MAMPPRPITDLQSLVDPRERERYVALLVISLTVYALLAYLTWLTPSILVTIVLYVGFGALFSIMLHGFMLGQLRGNGVRVSETQLPMLHRMVIEHARTLGMKEAPAVYVVQAGGLLNAFATRFIGRDFVVIYSDVLAMATRQGEHAVSYIVGHELGHVWRGHLKHRWLIAPGRMVPYLGAAYSRACEFTCDRIGAYCRKDGAIPGLIALAAGVDVYGHVNVREFAEQETADAGFWVRRAELLSTHPRLPRRVAALLAAGVPMPQVAEYPVRASHAA